MKLQANFMLFASILGCTASPTFRLHERAATTVTVSGSTATTYPQPAYEVPGFSIHGSCNGTERRQLEKALGDTIKIAQNAAQHIYAHGSGSEFYNKYFGETPTAEVIGWYEKVVHDNRDGIVFRCDDIDGNCHQDGWGGHWRGENGTLETVICPLSYSTRQPLEALCGAGYTVAAGQLNHYFASDLLHRLYHVSTIGEEAAEHYADTYQECLALAVDNATLAVRNSHSLQYFALDVYAYDVALPGEGCTGNVVSSDSSSAFPVSFTVAIVSSSSPTSSAVSSASDVYVIVDSPSSTVSSVPVETASRTSSAAAECHTHSDGVAHCA